MIRLSPQRRDLISIALLLAILLIAFPLLGSLFGERVPPPHTPTPTVTATQTPTPTPEPTKESRAAQITGESNRFDATFQSLNSRSRAAQTMAGAFVTFRLHCIQTGEEFFN